MAEIRIDTVVRAAEALRLAGRWDIATDLLTAVSTSDPAERAWVAVSLAETAVDRSFWFGEAVSDDVLKNAEAAMQATADVNLAWDVDLIRLRQAYQPALASAMSGGAVDAGEAERLDGWAERLRASAPDRRRAGWAGFWGGVIADNLRRTSEVAAERYTGALEVAEAAGDDLLASYAMRHLGGHAHDRGDLTTAREMWETATRLRERTGFVPGTLAQRLLLCELLLAKDDRAGAAALAADIQRAAEASRLTWLANGAARLLDRATGRG